MSVPNEHQNKMNVFQPVYNFIYFLRSENCVERIKNGMTSRVVTTIHWWIVPNSMMASVRISRGLLALRYPGTIHGRTVSTQAIDSTPGRLVDVSSIAMKMRRGVRRYAEESQDTLKLVGVLAHDGPFRADAEVYSNHVAMTCREDGIEYEECRVIGESYEDVEAAIQEANHRSDVHGILVYYPIFKARNSLTQRGPYKNRLTGVYYKTHDDYLRDVVIPTKDVEGLCHDFNARWLFRARGIQPPNTHRKQNGVVYPCTALSVLRILESQADSLHGKCVTIVNRSEILGRPLAAMLANLGASVFSVDAELILQFGPGGRLRRLPDMDLHSCLQESDAVVSGVPSPSFSLPCDMINPGSIVINVSEYENVPEDVLQIPGVDFVPHVGKVTVAALEENLVALHQRQQKAAIEN